MQRPFSNKQHVQQQALEENGPADSWGSEIQDGKRDWRMQALQTGAPPVSLEEGTREESQQMDWAKAWYPVAVIEDLDPKKPKGIMVLGSG